MPGRLGARTIAPIRVAFRQRNDVGTQNEGTFAAEWLAYALPCQRFADALAGICALTGGRCGSLLLHRDGLAPSTPCRSPGYSRFTPVATGQRTCRIGSFGHFSAGHLTRRWHPMTVKRAIAATA